VQELLNMSMKRKRAGTSGGDAGSAGKKARRDVGTSLISASHLAGKLQHPVLSRYFPRVVTLRTFLLSRIPISKQKKLANAGLAPDKRGSQGNILEETLVGVLNETSSHVDKLRQQEFLTFTQDPERSTDSSGAGSTPEHDIAEIVDFAIKTLFNNAATGAFRPKHVLCHGYQRAITWRGADRTPATVPKIPGLILEHPNENVNALKQAPWTEIYAMLGKDGDRVMLGLLLDCAVFLRLSSGKDNFYQLSGVPVADLTPLESVFRQDNGKNSKKALTASEVVFTRHQVLYAKPSLNSTGEVRFGMKHNHVLNRYPNSTDTKQTIHVMKYIFPRQFGLHNAFTSDLESKTANHGFKDYTLREVEISRHAKRLVGSLETSGKTGSDPRRLRGAAQDLVRKLQKNNKNCAYAQLLRYYTSRETARDSSTPQSVGSAFAKMQVTALITPNTMTTTSSIRQAAKASRGSVMQYATPTAQVSGFCLAVLRRLLPRDAFGTGPDGEVNREAVLRSVDHFIKMRRNESLNLHVVVQGIKISAVSWLKPPKLANLNMSASDRDRRWEIFNEFVYYIFDSLVIPLIRSNFYVTESSEHRSQLFCFRHDVWRKISEPSLAQLKLTMFEETTFEKTMQGLGSSTIRLLPKINGVRIIANLKKKVLKNVRGKMVMSNGINKQLEPIFDVLKYEQRQQPLRLGSSMFSINEIHGRLKEFKSRVGGQKLYFVFLDIKSCFDSIPQGGLMELAEKLLREDQYRMHKHSEIKGGEDSKISREFPRKAAPADDAAIFSADVASKMALNKKRTIFADTGNLWTMKTQPLLNMLREHITSNTVKIGKKNYRQKNGIPQGSILSSLLCSFFYGAFEAENLSFLDERSLLVRYIDDFLFITTEAMVAHRFLNVMVSGNSKYGITVQAPKSRTNFDATVNGRKIPRLHGTTAFPYIGFTIDTRTLFVSKGRAAKDPEVRNGLTVVLKQAGRAFRTKVLHSMKIQMVATIFDTTLNSKAQVISSLYQCFTETAMKMCRYVDTMPMKPSPALVINVLEESISLAFNLMRQQSQVREGLGYRCDVSKLQIKWVASQAILCVLRRKQSRYGEVLEWMSNLRNLTEPGIRIDQKTQKLIVEEGSRCFRNYVY
jgi:telomerase reverse transcriptase